MVPKQETNSIKNKKCVSQLYLATSVSSISPHISSYGCSPFPCVFSFLFLSLKIFFNTTFVQSLILISFQSLILMSFQSLILIFFTSSSLQNSSDRHFLRRKLCKAAHAKTISAWVLKENSGADLKIKKRDLNIPNILSMTFLKCEWRRLNSSFWFARSLPSPRNSCRWYRVLRSV